jgi:uncharacterized protein YukE
VIIAFEPLQPLPEDKVQTVLEYAKKLGLDGVSQIIDKIRDLFGHPENIAPRAAAWGIEAKVAIDDSTSSITNARADLKAYWEGSAYDSFETYVNALEGTFSDAASVFGKMMGHLQDIGTEMTNLYNTALRFLTECASEIVRVTGGVMAGIKEHILGVAQPVADAIAAFMANVGSVITDINTSISAYRTTGQSLKSDITDLKVPETIPRSAVDADGWAVRRRD